MPDKTKLKKNECAIGDGANITFQRVLPDLMIDPNGTLTISLIYKIEESRFQINLGIDPVKIKSEIGSCGVYRINDSHITKTIEFVAEDFILNALASGKILMRGSTGQVETDGEKGREGN